MTIRYQNPIPSPALDQMFDVFGVEFQFLVAPEETGNQTSLYKGIVQREQRISEQMCGRSLSFAVDQA